MVDRLIENAWTAYRNCQATGSKWGEAYWSGVIYQLYRKYNLFS